MKLRPPNVALINGVERYHGPVPESACPGCKQAAGGATSANSNRKAPKPGDASVCIECGQICRYGEDMELIAVSDAELLRLPQNVSKALRAMRRAVRDRVERFS